MSFHSFALSLPSARIGGTLKCKEIEQQDAKIEQQEAQLQEHKTRLRNLVQSLLKSGMSMEQIAQATNLTPQELQDLL